MNDCIMLSCPACGYGAGVTLHWLDDRDGVTASLMADLAACGNCGSLLRREPEALAWRKVGQLDVEEIKTLELEG